MKGESKGNLPCSGAQGQGSVSPAQGGVPSSSTPARAAKWASNRPHVENEDLSVFGVFCRPPMPMYTTTGPLQNVSLILQKPILFVVCVSFCLDHLCAQFSKLVAENNEGALYSPPVTDRSSPTNKSHLEGHAIVRRRSEVTSRGKSVRDTHTHAPRSLFHTKKTLNYARA